MKTFASKFVMLLTCMVLALTTTADAQKLRYKFKKGQKLHYEMSQNMKMVMNAMGQDIEVDMKQKMDMGWVVKSVDEKGVASIETKVTRLRIDFAMQAAGQNQSFQYDSDKKEEPDNFVAQTMLKAMKPIIGASTTMKMNSRGKILEFKLSEEAKKALADAAPPQQGFGGSGLNEDSLKSMASQSGIVFPEGTLTKGKTWKNKLSTSLGFAEMKIDSKYKYVGTETLDGKKVAKFSVSPKIELKAKENSPAQFELKSSDGTGTIYFDIATGQIYKTILNQNMTMEMDILGQKIDQDIDQEVSMKLIGKKKK